MTFAEKNEPGLEVAETSAESFTEEITFPSSETTEKIYGKLVEPAGAVAERVGEAVLALEDRARIAEESGIASKLEDIRRRAVEAKVSLGKAFRVVVFSAMAASEVFLPSAEARAEEVISTPETKVERFAESDLERAVLVDDAERVFLSFELISGEDSKGYEELPGQKESKKAQYHAKDFAFYVDSPTVETVRIAHTHPLHAVREVTGQDTSDLPNKLPEERPPAPPSLIDITSSIQIREIFADNGGKVVDEVYAPGGKWEFQIDDKNPAMKDLMEFRRAHTLARESLLGLLPPEERESALAALEASQYPHELDKLRREDPLRRFVDKTLDYIDLIDDRHPQAFEVAVGYQRHNERLINPREWSNLSEPERNGRISQYLEFCRQNGIAMKFTPYQKK